MVGGQVLATADSVLPVTGRRQFRLCGPGGDGG